MLGRDPLQHQLATAARAARRQPDRDHLVDVLGWTPVGTGAVGRTRLAAWALGVGRGGVFGERGGLALGRSAQRLDLATQPLVDLPQPLVLPAQPLTLSLQPRAFGLQPLLLLAQRGVLLLEPGKTPL
jgi:hypothetical protein